MVPTLHYIYRHWARGELLLVHCVGRRPTLNHYLNYHLVKRHDIHTYGIVRKAKWAHLRRDACLALRFSGCDQVTGDLASKAHLSQRHILAQVTTSSPSLWASALCGDKCWDQLIKANRRPPRNCNLEGVQWKSHKSTVAQVIPVVLYSYRLQLTIVEHDNLTL